jgi:hypothetical protein
MAINNATNGSAVTAQNSATEQEYPRWIFQKFTPDGQILPFPGNTIICHISPTSTFYQSLLELHAELQNQPFSSLYTLLPPESYHMTVAEGISDKIRAPGFWPADMAMDATCEECTAQFQQTCAIVCRNCCNFDTLDMRRTRSMSASRTCFAS